VLYLSQIRNKKMKQISPESFNNGDEEVTEEITIGDPRAIGLARIVRNHIEAVTPENGYRQWLKQHHRAIVGLGGLSLAGGFAAGGLVFSHHRYN
jgi:hypothetical protein